MKAYLSHAIRGRSGASATDEEMRKNCNLAAWIGQQLRKAMPRLQLYVPADHEFPTINKILTKKFISIKQILQVDCEIVEKCDILFVYVRNGWVGGGVQVEIKHAQKHHIPIYFIFGHTVKDVKQVAELVKQASIN